MKTPLADVLAKATPGPLTVAAPSAACEHCGKEDCECSDFDASPDMGAK